MRVPASIAVFAVLLAIPSTSRSAGPSVADRWKDRAVRAAAAVARIESEMAALRKQGVKRSSERYRELELAAMLERAFAEHLEPKREMDLRRALPGGDEAFVLALRPKRRVTFAISYVYDAAGQPLGARILSLPESWSVLVPDHTQEKGRRLLVDPGVPGTQAIPLFVFDLDDACASFVRLGR